MPSPEMPESHFGLPLATIEKIQGVLANCPRVESVLIYGSRAKGNYRNGSDIDLTLIGELLTEADIVSLETRLDDLLLPYKIDLSRFATIKNINLIEHIRRVGMLFYKQTQKS
ncbi:MAG: nucleotidyltransferase domain-containing protein [Betaproteobacteria bacterium]